MHQKYVLATIRRYILKPEKKKTQVTLHFLI